MKLPKITPPDPDATMMDRLMMTTPVVLTVIATLLAGLASSEMNLGQYYRGLAGQDQAKTGDQWGFFQAKRSRQAGIDNTVALLAAETGPQEFDANAWCAAVDKLPDVSAELKAALADESVKAGLATVASGKPPEIQGAPIGNGSLMSAVAAIEARQEEEQTHALVKQVSRDDLANAFAASNKNTVAFDEAIAPINTAVDRVNRLLEKQLAISQAKAASGGAAALQPQRDLYNAFTLARLRYSARRYGQEAKLNQQVANLYEVRVRQNSAESDRHRQRSKQFFYAMLLAQAGVVVATFGITQKKHSLWALATVAGLVALAYAIFVYVAM